MVPTEDVIEMREGKKVVTPKLFYPGYVLVEMEMNDYAWHLVRRLRALPGLWGPDRGRAP